MMHRCMEHMGWWENLQSFSRKAGPLYVDKSQSSFFRHISSEMGILRTKGDEPL